MGVVKVAAEANARTLVSWSTDRAQDALALACNETCSAQQEVSALEILVGAMARGHRDRLEHIGEQMIEAVGCGGAAELVDAIIRPDADRAALIGRLNPRDDAQSLAEAVIDLETDEMARLQLSEDLRLALATD